MAVPIVSQPQLEIGTAQVVFEIGWDLGQASADSYYLVQYDVPTDDRFLVVKNEPEAKPSRINVILNWFEELNRLVPITR